MPTSPATWFITGTSSGFGHAFAQLALDAGDNVVATARNVARLDALVTSAPERVLARRLDVTQPDDIRGSVEDAITRFGRIDVLVNNAGYGVVGAVEETPEAELRALMDTNFFGAIALTNAVLPTMRAQGSGAVVNISSMGGAMSFAGFGAYSATKFALEGASEALAQEVAPLGIKVLIVEPGAFRTDFAGAALRHMPEIEAYAGTVGPTREFASGMDNTQAGDPARAAAAVRRALEADDTPLRLQLGADSIDAVRAHATSMLDELAKWGPVGRATTFDEGTETGTAA